MSGEHVVSRAAVEAWAAVPWEEHTRRRQEMTDEAIRAGRIRRLTDAEVAHNRLVDAAAETAWDAVEAGESIPAARAGFVAAATALGETPTNAALLADCFRLIPSA